MIIKDHKIPHRPLDKKWSLYKQNAHLVSPHNRKHMRIIIVGAGLAGSSAASSLAEMGYQVEVFCYHDSARRAHSVAAQGGVNAAKNYKNDGDSRFFCLMCYDAHSREESCGAHFRVEYQTKDGEALRNDAEFAFNSLWQWSGTYTQPQLHREPLTFEFLKPVTRSYQ